jgi:hypothetical protein
MSSDAKEFPALNVVPFVALALLAGGVFVRTLPLESARPHEAGLYHGAYVGAQDVPARMWQDPFEVIPRSPRRETQAERRERYEKDSLHAPQKLTQQVSNALGNAGTQRIAVLGVLVSGLPYAEDTETRRRTRYAVLSGLAARGYVPDNPGALGYIWTEIDASASASQVSASEASAPRVGKFKASGPEARGSAQEVAPAIALLQAPEIVPYEWFSRPIKQASWRCERVFRERQTSRATPRPRREGDLRQREAAAAVAR